MEIKKKYLSIVLSSILCSMLLFFNACTQEEKEVYTDKRKEHSSELEFGKNRELTKRAAKEWYQFSQKPVTRMVINKGDDIGGILVTPSWSHAKEWRKGKYEAVEVSLRSHKGIIFVDNETREKIDSDSANLKKIKNIGRMVFLRDMETKKIISFNMVVIGSYKYLMKEDNQLSKNTYLERDASFDGTILFYHPNGSFANGWKYGDGKITHRLSPLEKFGSLTRSWVEHCYEECYPYSENICESLVEDDEEFGQVAVIECRTEWNDNCYQTCYLEWEDDYSPGDGNDGGYEPGDGGSGGNNTNQAYTPKSTDKMAKKNLPTTMNKQVANLCVSAIMEYTNNKVYGGSVNEGVYTLFYLQNFGADVFSEGVDLDNIHAFVAHFFKIDDSTDKKAVIDKGGVIMADVPVLGTNDVHNVLIIGYTSKGDFIYMDPELGYLQTKPESSLGKTYIICIIGNR